VAMARRLMPGFGGKRLHAYSAVHDDPESCIESRCIESLRTAFDVNLHAVQVPSFRGPVSVEDLVDLAWNHAHPVNNSILLPALMSLAASREGHRTVLHAAAGDLATAAPHYYPSLLLRKGRWSEAWRESKAASAHNYFLQGEPPVSIFARSLLRAFVPPAVFRWRQQLHRASQPAVPQSSLINPEFARAINLPHLVTEEFRARHQALRSDPDGFRRRQNLFLICSGLSGFSNVAGRYGMEARDPWSDRRVLDFFFRLPASFKVRDGWTKALQRTAFGQDLAPVVRERYDKRHLGWLFTARLMQESGGLLSSVLFEVSSPIEEYADLQRTREVFLQFLQTGDFESTQTVFEMATLIFWLRRIKTL
jgi:asparagine synthase (glutamine-hydrolysing)